MTTTAAETSSMVDHESKRTPGTFSLVFAELLNAKHEEHKFTVIGGLKFDKIIIESRKYGGRSVHAFCDKQGNVYKAAGWASPAKGIRFTNIFEAAEASTWHGSYLYLR